MLKKGVSRNEVELQIGKPIKIASMPVDKTVAVYEYEIGNEPSAGRAVAHGALDLVTLGLWEIIGTPVEACTGDKYQLSVTYDKDDIVTDVGSAH